MFQSKWLITLKNDIWRLEYTFPFRLYSYIQCVWLISYRTTIWQNMDGTKKCFGEKIYSMGEHVLYSCVFDLAVNSCECYVTVFRWTSPSGITISCSWYSDVFKTLRSRTFCTIRYQLKKQIQRKNTRNRLT